MAHADEAVNHTLKAGLVDRLPVQSGRSDPCIIVARI